MAEQRFKNSEWQLGSETNAGRIRSWEAVQVAVLMDIRDELQTLNRVFQCANFLRIPYQLNEIRKQTAPKKKKRVRQTVKA